MPSSPKSNRESSSPATTTTTTTPNKTPVKQLPGKLAKKVKHQFRRLDGVLHHVIHPKQHGYSITSPSSPLFYPVGVVRAFLPPDQSSASGSVDSRDIWDVKDGKEADLHSINSLANHSIDATNSSISTTHIDLSDEPHFSQEEKINSHEQDASTSVIGPITFIEPEAPDSSNMSSDANSQEVVSPTETIHFDLPSLPEASVISPATFIEPETPDSFLVDDGDSPSKEETVEGTAEGTVEENTSSSANSQQVVSPSETVPLNLPSSPEVSVISPTTFIEPKTPDSFLVDDGDSPSKEEMVEETAEGTVEENTSSNANSQQVVSSSETVPFDLPSSPEASVISPTAFTEPETPDSFLTEGDSPSEKETAVETVEENTSSDANSQQVASLSETVPFDLPSSPEVSVISPTTFIEPKTPNSFLVEGDSPSEEETAVETVENTSSDANSQQVASPSETVPFDLPSSPEVSVISSTTFIEPKTPNSFPLDDGDSPLKEETVEGTFEENTSSNANSQQVASPSETVPFDLPSLPEVSVISPTTFIVPETPDSFLVDDGDSPLKEETVEGTGEGTFEENTSSNVNSQQVVSPSETVPFNVPSSPEASVISPTAFTEPETPDSFLTEGDSPSEKETAVETVEENTSSDANSQQVVSPSDTVPLDPPSSSEASLPRPQPLIPNLQEDVLPPTSEYKEEYIPEIYVPALIVLTKFLPIPNRDPLITLLNKYIYPFERRLARDVTGEWQRNDFHTLVMTNSWRALARMARDSLVTSDTADLTGPLNRPRSEFLKISFRTIGIIMALASHLIGVFRI